MLFIGFLIEIITMIILMSFYQNFALKCVNRAERNGRLTVYDSKLTNSRV